jgi:hypothetical protein
MEGLKQNFLTSAAKIGAALGIATAAVAALSKGIKETVGVTMDYAAEVRDLQRASGMSAEETSKVIQVFDDMDVSAETLTMSLRKMSQEGITFSVDKMAEMSDEYLKLAEGAERNKFLLDNFGRSGLEMGKALEIGSDAIKQMADNMDGALILTQENVDAAREYEIAMDEMNDAVMGLKVSIGNQLIPVMTDLTNAFNSMVSIVPDAENGIENLNEALMSGEISHDDYKRAVDDLLKSLKIEIDEQGNLTSNMRGSESATDALKGSTALYSEAAYEAALATEEWDKHEKLLADQFNKETTPAIEDATDATNSAADAMRKYTEELLFSIASQGLTEAQALELAYAMGLVDEKTVYATQKASDYKTMLDEGIITLSEYKTKIAELQDSLEGLPKDLYIDVWLETHGLEGIQEIATMGGGGSGGAGFEQKALGGAVRGGQPIQWGEYGRPEMLITPSGGGQVVNAQQIVEAMRSSGMDIGNKGVTIQQQTIYTSTRADLIQYSIERARGYAL